jgi:hypothetical protein
LRIRKQRRTSVTSSIRTRISIQHQHWSRLPPAVSAGAVLVDPQGAAAGGERIQKHGASAPSHLSAASHALVPGIGDPTSHYPSPLHSAPPLHPLASSWHPPSRSLRPRKCMQPEESFGEVALPVSDSPRTWCSCRLGGEIADKFGGERGFQGSACKLACADDPNF